MLVILAIVFGLGIISILYVLGIIGDIRRYFSISKESKYWKRRATIWERFKLENKPEEFECSLVRETKNYKPHLWEYDCNPELCYDKEFFDKYGCIYIKNFWN